MPLSIIPVNQIFGKYDQQTRISELNRKNPVKTIQNQVDRVTISPEALKKRAISAALSAIQNSSQVSAKTKPATETKKHDLPMIHPAASGKESSVFQVNKAVQTALEKSKEINEEKEKRLQKLEELNKQKEEELYIKEHPGSGKI